MILPNNPLYAKINVLPFKQRKTIITTLSNYEKVENTHDHILLIYSDNRCMLLSKDYMIFGEYENKTEAIETIKANQN